MNRTVLYECPNCSAYGLIPISKDAGIFVLCSSCGGSGHRQPREGELRFPFIEFTGLKHFYGVNKILHR